MRDVIKIDKKRLYKAIEKMTQAVTVTLGPYGQTTVINGNYPIVTKDGVTIVKNLESPDPIENMVFKIIGEAARSVSRYVGDGTTTATLIACELVKLAIKDNYPISYELKEELRKEIKKLTDGIKVYSTSVTLPEDQEVLKAVASVSTNRDSELTDIALDAVEYTGLDGTVLIGFNRGIDTVVEKIAGFRLNKGIASPAFAKDKVSYQVIQEKPIIIVGNKPIDSLDDIMPFLQEQQHNNRPIALFCSAIHPNVMQILARNVADERIDLCVYDIPGTGTTHADYVNDIAVFAGVPAILDDAAFSYNELFAKYKDTEYPSRITRIMANPGICTLIAPVSKDVEERAINLRDLAKQSEDQSIIEELNRRASALLGKIASIKLGSSTMIAIQERLDRLDDAVHALQSALRNGVISGGAIMPYLVSQEINKADKITDICAEFGILNMRKESQIAKYYIKKVCEKLYTTVNRTDIKKISTIPNIYDPTEACTLAIDAGVNSAINLLSSISCLTEIKEK